MNPFTEIPRQRLAAAVIMTAFLPWAAFAQQVPPPPPEVLEDGIVPPDRMQFWENWPAARTARPPHSA